MNLFIVSDKTAILSIFMAYLKTFIQKAIVTEKQYKGNFGLQSLQCKQQKIKLYAKLHLIYPRL